MKKLFSSSKSDSVNGGGNNAATNPATNATSPHATAPAIPVKGALKTTVAPAISPQVSPTNTTHVIPTIPGPEELAASKPTPSRLDTNIPSLEADDDTSSHSPGSDTQAVTPSSPLDSNTSPKTVTSNTFLSPTSAVPPPLPTSPLTSPIGPTRPRPSVHFAPSVRHFLEAQPYSHQHRYNLTCGAVQMFDRPPTNHYRFSTLRENGVRGTYLQLVTSASTEGGDRTWDSCTPLPSFAARYQTTHVTKTERTIYWEVEILSLGFSKFSSVDGGNGNVNSNGNGGNGGAPGTATPSVIVLEEAEEEDNNNKNNLNANVVVRPSTAPHPQQQNDEGGITPNGMPTPNSNGGEKDHVAPMGLTRTVSATNTSKRPSNNNNGLGIGFVVKCVSPETVAYVRRRSSLRPIDEMPSPSSVNGAGVFWWSEDGDVHIDGKRTHKHVPAGVGDTIGIGITYKLPPGVEPNPDAPVEDRVRRRSSYMSANVNADELQQIPAEIFVTVNGEKTHVCSSASTNPFEPKIPEYLLGMYDVFPCIIVQGAGVECKIRIGEAVKWDGEGGSSEMTRLALGDKKMAEKKKKMLQQQQQQEKQQQTVEPLLPGTRKKKPGWWRAFSWGSNSGTGPGGVDSNSPHNTNGANDPGAGQGPKDEAPPTAPVVQKTAVPQDQLTKSTATVTTTT